MSRTGRHAAPVVGAPTLPGYAVSERIGAGADGVVWAAHRERDGAAVAVKVLATALDDKARRELAVLSRLGGDDVVRLHETLALDDGSSALVLDLMDGGSLGRVVAARGHLSPGETVTVLSPVASALSTLHAAGVVHGDVSPGNVLLDRTGRARLADLGAARIRGDVAGDVRGTEGFSAPEVVWGAAPSPASDVYAVGALGWLCLTGEVPAPAPGRGSLAERVRPALAGHPLVRALIEAMAGEGVERPSAASLALALHEAVRPEPLRIVAGEDDISGLTQRLREAAREEHLAAQVGQRPGAEGERGEPSRWSSTLRVRRVGRAAWASLGGAALLALLAVGAVLAVGDHEPAAAQSPAGVATSARPQSTTEPAGTTKPESATEVARTKQPAGSPTPGATRSGQSTARVAVPDPRRDPVAALQRLSDARASAWQRGLATALIAVDASGSPALQADTERLAGVQRDGGRYRDLAFVVRDARLEATPAAATRASTAAGGHDAVTLRARVDTTAYVVVSRAGEVRRPAQRGPEVLVDLVRTDAGWRVWQVRAG